MEKAKIWLAGINTLTVQGLEQILSTNGYETYTENVREVLEGNKELDETPDIVIWEEQLLESINRSVLKISKSLDKNAKSIFILSRNSMHFLGMGLTNGIQGYVHIRGGISELERCLEDVLNGSIFISPLLAGKQVVDQKKWESLKKVESLLTSQEQKILKHVSQKKTSKEIASNLNISYKTVQNHRQNICRKLGLRGRNKLFEFTKLILS